MKGAHMANDYDWKNMQTQQMPKHAQQYQQQQHQQQYQQYPSRQINMQVNEATTTGAWVLTLFLMVIPIVNIILLFVWAFSSNTETSKRNWARANLVWILIGIIVSVVLVLITMALGVNYQEIIYNVYPRF